MAPQPRANGVNATACFYGLLNVLTAPLARFVTRRDAGESTPRGVLALLQHLVDHGASAPLCSQVMDAAREVQLVQNQVFIRDSVSADAVVRGIRAVYLLIVAVDTDGDAARNAHALCQLLNVPIETMGEATQPVVLQSDVDGPCGASAGSDGDKHSLGESSVPYREQSESLVRDWEPKFREYVQQGLAFAAASDHKAADRVFSQALELLDCVEGVEVDTVRSMRVTALGHKARAALALHTYASTIKLARQGFDLDHGWTEGYRLQCRALKELGRFSEALRACDAVLSRVPHDAIFLTLKDELKLKQPPVATTKVMRQTTPTSDAKESEPSKKDGARRWCTRELLRKGVLSFQEQNYAEAEMHFSKALICLNSIQIVDENVRNVHVRLLGHRARCRLAMEKFPGAIKDAQAGLAIRPEWVDGNRISCRALMGQSLWRKAAHACENVLNQVPHDVAFQKIMDKILAKCGGESRLQSDPVKKSTTDLLGWSKEFFEDDLLNERHATRAAFAHQGSRVAFMFVEARSYMAFALKCLHRQEMEDAFDVLKSALSMWPILEIPVPVLNYFFTSIGSHKIMLLGGDLVLFLLQAKMTRFYSAAHEIDFWTERVERLPDDPTLRDFLADALYRAGDLERSLHHAEEALKLRGNAGLYVLSTSYYYRARCLPSRLDVKESSIVDWMHSIFSVHQPSREDALLAFIKYASIDDEWMPHAAIRLASITWSRTNMCERSIFTTLPKLPSVDAQSSRCFLRLTKTVFQTSDR